MQVMKIGSTGPDVQALQDRLRERGFNPGATDGTFGPATQAAVLALQRSEGLLADGVAGPRTQAALGLVETVEIPTVIPAVTVAVVSRMFPATPVVNIRENLPVVLEALLAPCLTERQWC